MRSFRLSVFALAIVAAGFAPSVARAQNAVASWQDSWYWGAYGGQTQFSTAQGAGQTTTTAPTIGIDWVITRSRFALNVFAEQSYFNAISTVQDSGSAGLRKVDFQDMRRIGFSAMIFTPSWRMVKPWFGAGYAFNFIKQANPEGNLYTSPGARDTVLARVNDARTEGKLFGEVGVMAMFGRYAPFLQYSIMPSKGTGAWLINGDNFTNIWKAGVRVNFGNSIEKKW
jgi:hypothetical protein